MKRLPLLSFSVILVFGCEQVTRPTPEALISTVPKVGSVFVFDYEQRIIPVKPEDDDTTYRFTLSANVLKDGLTIGDFKNAIEVRMLDDNGEVSAMDRYFLATAGPGDVYYNIPYFSGEWIRLPVASHQRIEVTSEQKDGTHWSKKVSTVSSYLGTEDIGD
jgi:hypothetical protein